MAAEETRIDTPAAPTPAARGRGGRVGLVLQVVNTGALLAVLALQVLRPGGLRREVRADERTAPAARVQEEGARPAAAEASPGPTLRLADFVVHLRDADADRYARMSFDMELRDDKAREGVTARIPQIRDAFLGYLSDRTSEEFRGSEAIARIKAALADKLGALAPPGGVRALYLTELVVQ